MKSTWIAEEKKLVLTAEDDCDTYDIGRIAAKVGKKADKWHNEKHSIQLYVSEIINLILNK